MKLVYLYLALAFPFLGFGQSTPCSIVHPGNDFENAEFGLHTKYIANDFDIAEGETMTINKIVPTIVNNIDTATIFIYEDDNGQPGNVITSFTEVAPISQTQVSSNFNLPWYEVELELPSPVILEGLPGGSKYWLGLIVAYGTDATSNFWEVKSNGTTAVMHSSLDQGATWTANPSGFDGVFEVHGECNSGTPVLTEPCEIVEAGNDFENAEFGLHTKYIANDFDIAEGETMTINKIIPTIVNNIDTATIFIYEDNNGQPGNVITSFTEVAPISQTQVSSNFNLPWYEVELELPSPVTLEGLSGGSKYWLGLIVAYGTDATSNFWEVKSNGTTAVMHSSLDQGATWTPSPSDFDGVFQLIGACVVDAPPAEPCELVEAGNDFENAEFGLHTKYIANDFDIAEGETMTIEKIIPTIVNNIDTATIFIYEDNNGQPGNVITSFTEVAPISQTQVSSNFNLPWYEVELELPSPVTLEGLSGGSKYWLGLIVAYGTDAASNFWEVKSNGTTAVMHSSLDQGATWTPSPSDFDGVFQLIGTCIADAPPAEPCEIVEAGNDFENAELGLNLYQLANDFDIAGGITMEITKIIPNIVYNIEVADIFIYEDDNGQPGSLITSFNDVTPTSQVEVSTNLGYPWYEVTLDLPSPVILEGEPGGTKYWVGLYVTMGTDASSFNFWEVKSNGTTAQTYISEDEGATWEPNVSGADGVFQISGNCTGELLDEYCVIEVNVEVAPITQVTFAGIDNTTSTEPTSPAHEYYLDIEGNVAQGVTYDISLQGNTNGDFTSYFTAFIDWNNNEVLDDAGEVYELGTLTNSTGNDGQVVTSNITVPLDAVINNARMRIIKAQDAYVLDPCNAIDVGQAEDYTLLVAEVPDIYCEVEVSITVEPITRVLFADIDNISSSDTSSPAHEYFLDVEGNVAQGGTYDITVEGNTNGTGIHYYTAFIDWNQNEILDDAGEVYQIGSIENSTGTDGQQATVSIDVPLDVATGSTRIRIIKWHFEYPIDPCETIAFGQAEDYTLHISEYENPYCEIEITEVVTPITNVTFAGIENASSAATNAPAQEIFIDISGTVEQGNEYIISLEGFTNGDNTHYFTAFFDWNKNNILDDAGEIYELGTITNSTGTDGVEMVKVIQVPASALLGTTRMKLIKSADAYPQDPCGEYASGQAEDYSIEVFDYCLPDIPLKAPITQVIFAGINNSSPSDPFTTPSYEPFLEIEANVITGETYDVTLQGNPIWDLCFSVFIDWNQNGILNDAGEVYEIDCVGYVPGGGAGELALGTIAVPENAEIGKTRMRVITNADSGFPEDPCGSYYYGQAEDYSVIVKNALLPDCELECPEDIMVEIPTGQTSTVVAYDISFNCDNPFDVTLELVEGLPSGSEFPVGVTTVLYNLVVADEVINTCEFTVTVESILNSEEFKEDSFKIYPNPVDDILTVFGTKTINTIYVFDVAGKKVYSEHPNTKESRINLTAVQSGVYFVKIISGTSVRLVRVVKN